MIDSKVSAKIDGRRHPALLSSPSPNRIKSPKPIDVAIVLSELSLTSCARKRLKSPSSIRGNLL